MITKSAISQIRLLHHKKHRDEQNLFIVEGIKSCAETLNSNFEITNCYSCLPSAEADGNGLSAYRISPAEMSRISCLTTPSEILCVVKKKEYQLSDLEETKPLLVLDGIRDPGNLGTIMRTADWFGFDQILCSEDCVEYTNPKVIQATMGSFTRVKTVYANLKQYLETQSHRTIYGLYMKGESVQKQSFNNNDIVIIGSESHGISETLAPYIKTRIAISMFPHNGTSPESLNAAIAAGIFMYAHRTITNYELRIKRN